MAQAVSTGVVSYTNEDGAVQNAIVVSTDVGNAVGIGSDGGAYLNLSSNSETTTTMMNNNNGTYTYTNESNVSTIVNNDMGTYTGTTITDNVSIHTALQQLETKLEAQEIEIQNMRHLRIGEFVYAEAGKSLADGYLAIQANAVVSNASVNYPIWFGKAPTSWKNGNNIKFPSDVGGIFLRNSGGLAGSVGYFQDDATAVNGLDIDPNGAHYHRVGWNFSGGGTQNINSSNDGSTEGWKNTESAGNHDHSIRGEDETRPKNYAFQLYVIVDSYIQ
jgi:hypothetical protein